MQLFANFSQNVFDKSMNDGLFSTFQPSIVADDRKNWEFFRNFSALTIFSGCSALMKLIKKRLSEVVCLSLWLSCQIEREWMRSLTMVLVCRHVICQLLERTLSAALTLSMYVCALCVHRQWLRFNVKQYELIYWLQIAVWNT